jgi:tRNA A-37 threonylcarbamoyl transferase component Bud32
VYFVNWQRDVSVQERDGRKVVVKRSKPTKDFHEYLLVSTYTAISVLLGHPSAPPRVEGVPKNEGAGMRKELARLGVPTPKLLSMTQDELVEEYIEGGDLYRALVAGADASLASQAGVLTALLHNAGLAFTDNKAQNYLVRAGTLLRTDLAFMQKSSSTYARSMDVGSFLASIVDLPNYRDIEREFYSGYSSKTGSRFPYLSLIIRNILLPGFSSDSKTALKNMMLDSSRLVG